MSNSLDWGRVSDDYARYRDVYPPEFYNMIWEAGICVEGQCVLDLGTGTGVLPRMLYTRGARIIGCDISEGQIEAARRLAAGLPVASIPPEVSSGGGVAFICAPAEELEFPDAAFDAVTACQCINYFDLDVLLPRIRRFLKPQGTFAVLSMSWRANTDEVTAMTDSLIREHNPSWLGSGINHVDGSLPDWAERHGFGIREFREKTPSIVFTRESWNGRILASRGVGASLTPEAAEHFSTEHMLKLEELVPPEFAIAHSAAMLVLEKLKTY